MRKPHIASAVSRDCFQAEVLDPLFHWHAILCDLFGRNLRQLYQ